MNACTVSLANELRLDLPISSTDVASVVGRNTSTVNDDTENHEAHTSSDFDHTDDKLDFAVASNAKVLNCNECREKWYDPSSIVDIFNIGPEMDDIAGSGDFKGQDGQPGDSIFPSASETPGGVNESANVHREGAVDRIQNRHLGEGLHHRVHLKS